MKISVESYYNGEKLLHTQNNTKPKIKNPTVLSIIDNAIERNNRQTYNKTAGKYEQ